ncbi:MAG: hypothetical protein ACYCZF_10150 [Anaerolineae bacterium]
MINPYIIDRPLTDHDWFVGRESAFKQLLKTLGDDQRMVLLCGRRYNGKTSFVNQLPNYVRDSYRLVNINWDPAASSDDPFWELLVAISEITNKPLLEPKTYANDPYTYGFSFLRMVCGQGSRNITLFCLDSIDVNELSTIGKWETVFSCLLDILAGLPSAAFLIVVEGHPSEINTPTSVALPIISLRPLDDQAVEDLVSVPARAALVYDYELIRQLGGLAGGEPFLVQILAKLLFDSHGNASWLGPNAIDNVVEAAQEIASSAFSSLWESATPKAQIMLSGFAAMTGHHGVGSVDDLVLFFRQQHLAVPKDDIILAVNHLADRDILQRLGGGVLQYKCELFRLWLKRNHTLHDVLTQHRFYHRTRAKKPAAWQGRRVDWVGVFLWILALGLVAAIIILWRSRDPSLFQMTPFRITQQTPIPTVNHVTETAKITHLVYQGRPDNQAKWIIYYMRNDGSARQALTSGDSNDTNASLSPDGRKVVFVSDRDGNREIYSMNVDGTNPVNLIRNSAEDWTPTWSPDGRYIAFASFRDGNWEIYYMNADGSRPTRITQSAAAEYSPSWSPDGKSLAYVSDRDGNIEIYILTLDGAKERRYTNNPATDQSPAWSPDGKSIAWASYRDGNMEIYVAGVDGSSLRNLTQDPSSDDQGPAWSPDGQHIAFFSNRDHGWDIHTFEIATGKRANNSQGQGIEQSPSWGQ